MNITKAFTGAALATGLTALLAGGAMAQAPVTFASITGAGTGISSVFTYTSGASGGFSITPGAQFIASFPSTFTTDGPATVTFTGLNNVGTVTGGPTNYSQLLSGGTFDVSVGTTTLLKGTFDGGTCWMGRSAPTPRP